jgi:exodeoxyribonuclease-3
MKLISWNVNGLRAALKKGFLEWMNAQDVDVVGIQETKADVEQLPEEVVKPVLSGKQWYACFASSKVKKGYSGVALFCKEKPDHVEYGMGVKRFDDEGRYIAVHFKDIVIINCYFPNGGGGPERLSYKMDFYKTFLKHIQAYRTKGKKVIFMGDVNTAHTESDLARPKDNEKNTGFLPMERAWLDEAVAAQYVDTFRHLHPEARGAYSYWDMKTRARERNVGWRIDYIFVDAVMKKKISRAEIHADIFGSDHCPIFLEIEI